MNKTKKCQIDFFLNIFSAERKARTIVEICMRMKAAGRVDSHSAFGACFHPAAGSFQASYEPHEKPLLQARYRLIYSRKVAIVDIEPATPTLYRKRMLRALRYADREWCRLTRVILHLTPAIAVRAKLRILSLFSLPYLFITSAYAEYWIFFPESCVTLV